MSCDAVVLILTHESPSDCMGIMGDGSEKVAGCGVRLRPALFPVSYRCQFKAELQSELFLRHRHCFADGFDIHLERRRVGPCGHVASCQIAYERRNIFDRRQFDDGFAMIEQARHDRVGLAQGEMPLGQG
jgi:hypothetical protein